MIAVSGKAFAIASAGVKPGASAPAVARLADGRFVVVWEERLGRPTDGLADTDGAVFARIYSANGRAVSDTILVNDWAPGTQGSASVVAAADGGFLVLWQSRMVWGSGLIDEDAVLSRFDRDGDFIGPASYLEDDNPLGDEPDGNFVQDLGGGAFAVIHHDTEVSIYLGVGQAPAQQVSFAAVDSVAGLARLAGGNIVVAMVSTGGNAVLVLSDETLQGAPAGIPGQPGPVSFVPMQGADVQNLQITALTPGTFGAATDRPGFAVSALLANGMAASILAVETYTPWGRRIGVAEVAIPISLNDAVPDYDILALPDGSFVLAWQTLDADGTGVAVQHFDADGSALGDLILAPTGKDGDQGDPQLSLLKDGSVLLVYSTESQKPVNGAVETLHAVKLDVTHDATDAGPTDLADALTLTAAADALDALGGDDVIYARAGDDLLRGGDGNDRLYGETGNDALQGGDGADRLYGGSGKDGLDGAAGADLLQGGAGRDALAGGAGADTLQGGDGADRLTGGGGNDRLTGGAEADAFVFGRGAGQDVITDFAAEDSLRLDRALWSAAPGLSADQVLDRFADIRGDDLVFTFDGGEVLTITGGAWMTAAELVLI